jgi:hypothetical protein
MASVEHAIEKMGEMGEKTLQIGFGEMVASEVCSTTKLICALEVGTSIG